MQTRYKTQLHTPGDNIPKPEIVRFRQDISDQFKALEKRRNEMQARLSRVKNDISEIERGLGIWVFEGCDHEQYTSRLAKLRAETEALQYGLTYVSNQIEMLRRQNSWL